MIPIKEKPNKLFEDGPDWTWDDNLKHWFSTTDDGFKAIIWTHWMNPPPPEEKQKKLSKSDGEMKIEWDGICTGVPGGPEPNQKAGPILSWIRRGIAQQRLRRGSETRAVGGPQGPQGLGTEAHRNALERSSGQSLG